jgi:hypothetical protein
MKEIKFEKVNRFFQSDPEIGIEVCERNKEHGTQFCYQLELPDKVRDSHIDKMDVLRLQPIRIKHFHSKNALHWQTTHGPIGEGKRVLVGVVPFL